MSKIFLTSLATAMLLASGFFAPPAQARTTAAAPPALVATTAPLIREAAIVCGGNGCNTVQTKAQKKRKFQTLGHG